MSEGLLLSGRYRLIRQLGSGGMGSVWLARDLNLQVDVAIKLIDPSVAESSEAVGRFQLEARAAAAIRSTHVVQILDHGIDGERPFIAMELLKGESLGQRLERVGRLAPLQTGLILGQVGRALTLAHNWGIVHRDLKPDNIFLVTEGEDEIAKVLDFGIARRMTGLSEPSQSKTRTGAMLGTPYYMSPEQATGQSVDHLSDIWSFGVIAFECLTGCRAFEGDTIGSLFHAVCMQPMPVPSTSAAVPAGFDEWFRRAVARDKTFRFATIKEASETLRNLCGCTNSFGVVPDSLSGHSTNSTNSTNNTNNTMLSGPVAAPATAVAAVSTKGSRNTFLATTVGRVRRRPYLSGGIALSAIALLALSLALHRGKSVTAGVEPSRPSPLTASSVPIAVTTHLPVDAKSVLSVSTTSASDVSTLAASHPSAAAATSGAVTNRTVKRAVVSSSGSTTQTQKSTGIQKPKASVNHRDDNAAGI